MNGDGWVRTEITSPLLQSHTSTDTFWSLPRVTTSTQITYSPAICKSNIVTLDKTSFCITARPSKMRTANNIASG